MKLFTIFWIIISIIFAVLMINSIGLIPSVNGTRGDPFGYAALFYIFRSMCLGTVAGVALFIPYFSRKKDRVGLLILYGFLAILSPVVLFLLLMMG